MNLWTRRTLTFALQSLDTHQPDLDRGQPCLPPVPAPVPVQGITCRRSARTHLLRVRIPASTFLSPLRLALLCGKDQRGLFRARSHQ